VGENDRKLLKEIRRNPGPGREMIRTIPQDALTTWAQKLEDLKSEVAAILEEEREEKQVLYIRSLNASPFPNVYLIS
jgi:ATP-dependent RNA helicase DDX27